MPESKTISFIAEYKQKIFLEKLFKENTIEMNDYFKDSRRVEKKTCRVIMGGGKRFKLIIRCNPLCSILWNFSKDF